MVSLAAKPFFVHPNKDFYSLIGMTIGPNEKHLQPRQYRRDTRQVLVISFILLSEEEKGTSQRLAVWD